MAKIRTMSRRTFLHRAGFAALAAPYIVPGTSLGNTTRAAPSQRISLGIIGLKKMGRAHVKNLLGYGQVQIVAVCDVDTNAREEARKRSAVGPASRRNSQSSFSSSSSFPRFP